MTPNHGAAANRRAAGRTVRLFCQRLLQPTGHFRRWALSLAVTCDMKLHSILLGWTKVLTKSCVSPQVFHGSMRLTGCGREATTVRGVKPSR